MKVIGIQSYENALKIKEKELKENKQELKVERIRLFFIFLGIEIIASLVAFGLMFTLNGFKNPFIDFGAIDFFCLTMFLVLGFFLTISFKETEPLIYLYDFSPVWQYAYQTKGKNVLHQRVLTDDGCELVLDLEDIKTKRVSQEKIGLFRMVTQTDVTEVVVDLEKGLVICPYKGRDGVIHND